MGVDREGRSSEDSWRAAGRRGEEETSRCLTWSVLTGSLERAEMGTELDGGTIETADPRFGQERASTDQQQQRQGRTELNGMNPRQDLLPRVLVGWRSVRPLAA